MTLTPLDTRVTEALACGRVREYARSPGSMDVWVALEPLPTRASREMSCEEGRLTITAERATVRRVVGCRREARYDLMCGADQCAWAMTTHAGAAPPREPRERLASTVESTAPTESTTAGGEVFVPEPYRATRVEPETASAEPRVEGDESERRLRAVASRDLSCSDLALTSLRPRVVQVLGCGRLGEYAASASDPGAWAPIETMIDVAETEMACEVGMLTVAALATTIRTAVGCGRSARYELTCSTPSGSAACAWRMTAHAGAWDEAAATL